MQQIKVIKDRVVLPNEESMRARWKGHFGELMSGENETKRERRCSIWTPRRAKNLHS